MATILRIFSILISFFKDSGEVALKKISSLLLTLFLDLIGLAGIGIIILVVILIFFVSLFAYAPNSLIANGDPLGNYNTYQYILTDTEFLKELALDGKTETYDKTFITYDISVDYVIALDSVLNLRPSSTYRSDDVSDRIVEMISRTLDYVVTESEDTKFVYTPVLDEFGRQIKDADGVPKVTVKKVSVTKSILEIKALSQSQINSNFGLSSSEIAQLNTFIDSLNSGILNTLVELYDESDTYIEAGSVAGAVSNSFEGKNGIFEYDAGLYAISERATNAKISSIYSGSLEVDFKNVTYRDNTVLSVPVFEDNVGEKGGTVSSGVYSLAVLDSSKLKQIPTEYTGGGKLFADERVIPVLVKMLNDMKKAGLSEIVVLDAYRSQTRQAILFVTANCNSDARRLNSGDAVQKWIATQTGKTVSSLKSGDTSGIDWGKLSQKMATAPSYIKDYGKYIAIPKGTNSHSTGRAFDFAGMSSKHKTWLQMNVKYYGFYNYDKELWHWEYNMTP